MRRRNSLRPDTFPFLAVLLCTMGSLILILMVLDRRARLAARTRAEEAWARAEKEEAEQAARLRSRQEQQWQQQRQARLDRHQREQARLTTQEKALRVEYERVRSQLETTLRTLQEGERRQTESGQQKLASERRLAEARQSVAHRKQELAQVAK